MALTADEQDLLDFALSNLPHWFQDDSRPAEYLGAAAKMNGTAKVQAEYWFSQTRILEASGTSGSDPDWLAQHARDRGTFRQAGETDPALRERLRTVPDAVTRPTLIAAANAILAGEGFAQAVVMLELRRDRAFFRTSISDTGTGGLFDEIVPASTMAFTPDAGFATPPFRTIEEDIDHRLVFSGAASAGNDGAFDVIGLDGDSAQYLNASGVDEADPGVSWTVEKRDRDGNLLDGHQDSYLSRGDRFGSNIPTIILILPFGCTEGTKQSVQEMLRQKKGAGIRAIVECMDGWAWPLTSAGLKTALFGTLGAAPAGDFDSIYQPAEISGEIEDFVSGNSLTPSVSPAPQQGVISVEAGARALRLTEGSAQNATAAAANIFDMLNASFGLLLAFRVTEPTTADRVIVGKATATTGYGLILNTSNELRWRIDDNVAVQADAIVTPVAPAEWDDGKLALAYVRRNKTASTIDIYTSYGTASVADASASIANTALFALGSSAFGLLSAGVDIVYMAIVTTAALAESIGEEELSNFAEYLGLGRFD